MADTNQCVNWALEHTCPLRTGEAVANVGPALCATGPARSLADALNDPERKFGVFGDVRVTSYSYSGQLPKHLQTTTPPSRGNFLESMLLGKSQAFTETSCIYPTSGYLVSQTFQSLGGADGLKSMCLNCPVNATRPSPAGCAGWLGAHPHDPALQNKLQTNITRHHLQSQVAQHFLVTNPIWFGLWTKSPLSPEAAALLIKLLTPTDYSGPPPHAWLQNPKLAPGPFLVALQIAHTTGAKLHVRMAPPGHTDFGHTTTFAHCPVCKAETSPRWWGTQSMPASYKCKICATTFSPAQQYADEPDSDDSHNPDQLQEALGQERYKQFIIDYLVAQNYSSQDALDIYHATQEDQRAQREERQQQHIQSQTSDTATYLRESLFAGLTIQPGINSKPDDINSACFNAQDFQTLLDRCGARKIPIFYLSHQPPDSKNYDRFEVYKKPGCLPFFSKKFNANAIFSTWRAQGCNGLFHAGIHVPGHVVTAFLAQKDESSR